MTAPPSPSRWATRCHRRCAWSTSGPPAILLTVHDNWAFLPYFCRALRSTAARVRQREVEARPWPGRTPEETFRLLHADRTEFRERYWFLQWGETVDNASKYAYLDDGDLVVVFAFWRIEHPHPRDRGRVFCARLDPDRFAAVTEAAADLLEAEGAG
ncbi:hypothetical protein [Micromonospora sp. NPDC049282]|uniref:hypothetical protein n=1 Tax=Micromonospora sp. NPDC049282 TaxID=3364269 RepID=UPI00372230C2